MGGYADFTDLCSLCSVFEVFLESPHEHGRVLLQIACLLLGDSVPHRIHWPRNADLRVNNMQYRPYGRSAGAKLGPNARDEPASVGVMCSVVSTP